MRGEERKISAVGYALITIEEGSEIGTTDEWRSTLR
jgi:hypothetical protein